MVPGGKVPAVEKRLKFELSILQFRNTKLHPQEWKLPRSS
jgi:hypothetical protein